MNVESLASPTFDTLVIGRIPFPSKCRGMEPTRHLVHMTRNKAKQTAGWKNGELLKLMEICWLVLGKLHIYIYIHTYIYLYTYYMCAYIDIDISSFSSSPCCFCDSYHIPIAMLPWIYLSYFHIAPPWGIPRWYLNKWATKNRPTAVWQFTP